jgi:hypothetical protein
MTTIVTFRYKIDAKTILGVTANKDNESGTATSRRVAKGESNPAPLFPGDNVFSKPVWSEYTYNVDTF